MRQLSEQQIVEQALAAAETGDYDRALSLQRLIDEATPPRPVVPLLSAALWYAEQGLRVFPLEPGGKRPLPGSHGCKDATSDATKITNWWRGRPSYNIGIATGCLVDVIDIDGPIGVASWATIENLPPILGSASTSRAGGTHLYVAATGEGNGAALFPGIDYRGQGGYVVAPPSVGPTGTRYRWRRPLNLPAQERIAA